MQQTSRDEPLPFFVRWRFAGAEASIELGGECDASSLDRLNAAFEEVLAAGSRRVVVDLTDVTFVDSLTLGAFTAAAKRVRGAGGSFVISGVTATEVRRVFEITGLDTYLLADASDPT